MDEIKRTICVIGGGPAGYTAAIRAAELGASVALVEKSELGGTCLNCGCIPTKALLKTAGLYEEAHHAGQYGLGGDGALSPSPEKAFARKENIVRVLRTGLAYLMKKNGITVLQGTGRAVSAHRVEVTGNGQTTVVLCDKLILAAGSVPSVPPVSGTELAGVMTSDGALDLKEIPKRVLIVGAGVIGIEFATYFSAFGSEVTVVEMMDAFLPQMDPDVSAALMRSLKRRGVKFRFGSALLAIERGEDGLTAQIRTKTGEERLVADGILLAAGRRLCGSSPELEGAGIRTERGAAAVNEHMETSVKDVYAAGDIAGAPLLAHLAFAQGKTAAENALGMKTSTSGLLVPSCIYSEPEVSAVGLSEQAARSAGVDFVTGRSDFRGNGRALTLGSRDGFVKVLADKTNGRLLGASIFGPSASEMISELTLAVSLKASARDVAGIIHPHPSLSEAVGEACADTFGEALQK